MMQTMVNGPENDKNMTVQKEWLKKAAMQTFTPRELEKMAEQKRGKKVKNNTKYGIACGLPEDYDVE